MVLNFERPVKLVSVFLKKHRDMNFYLKKSGIVTEVQTYFQGHLTMNASIIVYNDMWKLYAPQEELLMDKLVIPAGIDMDNLLIDVSETSVEGV